MRSLREFLETVPWAEEPLSEEDRLAIQEGLAEAELGEIVEHEEVVRLHADVQAKM